MNEQKKTTGKVKIRQNSETGRLRSCFIAASDKILCQPMTEAALQSLGHSSLVRDVLNRMPKDRAWDLKEEWPEAYDKVVENHEDLYNTLTKLGVEVLKMKYDPILDKYFGYMDAGFAPLAPEDAFKVIGNVLLQAGLSTTVASDAAAPFGYYHHIDRFLEQDKEFTWMSVPPMYPTDPAKGLGPGPFASPAEMLIMPNKTVLCSLGVNDDSEIGKPDGVYSAFSMSAIDILNRMFKPYGWTFEPHYYRTKYSFHCTGNMTPLREGLVAVAPDVLPLGLPKQMEGWDVINISHEEAELGAANVLQIDSKNMVVEARTPRFAEELAKRGIEPHPVNCEGTHMVVTAGPRCNTIVLSRDDD